MEVITDDFILKNIEEERWNNLKIIIDKYKNICINISEFVLILEKCDYSDKYIDFNPVTIKTILQTGKYALFKNGSVTCWVSKDVPPGYFRFSDKEVISNDDSGFSINIFIGDNAERYLKLKAFW